MFCIFQKGIHLAVEIIRWHTLTSQIYLKNICYIICKDSPYSLWVSISLKASAPQPFSTRQRGWLWVHHCHHNDLSTSPGSKQCRGEAIKVMKEAKAIKVVCEGNMAEMSLTGGSPGMLYSSISPIIPVWSQISPSLLPVWSSTCSIHQLSH